MEGQRKRLLSKILKNYLVAADAVATAAAAVAAVDAVATAAAAAGEKL